MRKKRHNVGPIFIIVSAITRIEFLIQCNFVGIQLIHTTIYPLPSLASIAFPFQTRFHGFRKMNLFLAIVANSLNILSLAMQYSENQRCLARERTKIFSDFISQKAHVTGIWVISLHNKSSRTLRRFDPTQGFSSIEAAQYGFLTLYPKNQNLRKNLKENLVVEKQGLS